MYSDTTAPTLKTADSRNVCLQGVDIRVDIHDYLATTRMTYRFLNDQDVNIEAVYTFPLPIDGVLTDLRVKIGQREMHGVAVEKSQAQEEYEQAVCEGDSPIMLERLDSGLYSLNIGNIMSGELAEVSIEFLEILRIKSDEVRYELPTTLAPLYGDPSGRGLEPHQYPATSLLVDNRCSIEVEIKGCLINAGILTPSHKTLLVREEGRAKLTLSASTASMDRDFILVIRSESLPAAFAISAMDKGRYVVCAGFTPRFTTTSPPKSVKIIVDCSGSMAGESIRQARVALLRILDRLRPEDQFNIIRFGSSSTMLFRKQEVADETHLQAAVALARTMDANMGGTEIVNALDKALSSASPKKMSQDILLITDGQVWDIASVADRLLRKKHRVFSIGVGLAVERNILNNVSVKTGGEAIFVSALEDMGKKVYEHFKRMTNPQAKNPDFDFDGRKPLDIAPQNLPPVFDGDMVMVCAWLESLPQNVTFSLETPEGPMTWHSSVRPADVNSVTLPRFASGVKIHDLSKEQAVNLAVEYNLVSMFTNYLVVLERADTVKSQDLPRQRTVEHNMPHNWGLMLNDAGAAFDLMPLSDDICGMNDDLPCPSYTAKDLLFDENETENTSLSTWQEVVLELVLYRIKTKQEDDISLALLEFVEVILPKEILTEIRDLLKKADMLPQTSEQTLILALALALAKDAKNISQYDLRRIRKALCKKMPPKEVMKRIENLAKINGEM